ncbi:MAG: ABC transporter permease [Actinobacteria bacterium]|nr:ABC transporter permease [Actinomycetota bacterium]
MRARRLVSSGPAVSLLAAAAALVVSSLLSTAVGASPGSALAEIWRGAFGTEYQVGVTLTKALPLVLVALGFTIALRAGVFNIGLEGQLYAGGLAAALVGAHVHANGALVVPLCILAAGLAGAAWALLPAVLKLSRGVNEIVSSLLLNYVMIFLVNYLIGGPLKDGSAIYPQTPPIEDEAHLAVLVSGTKIHAGIFVALIAALLVWVVLARTTIGFEMGTAGASERVARYVGIDVRRTTLVAFLASGALGGLAGAVEILGNQFRLLQSFSPGWGYTGIAVALLGGATAWGCVLAGLYFGVLGSGADQLQFKLGVPSSFVLIVQALAVLLVLASEWLRDLAGRRHAARRARRRVEEHALRPEGADP